MNTDFHGSGKSVLFCHPCFICVNLLSDISFERLPAYVCHLTCYRRMLIAMDGPLRR